MLREYKKIIFLFLLMRTNIEVIFGTLAFMIFAIEYSSSQTTSALIAPASGNMTQPSGSQTGPSGSGSGRFDSMFLPPINNPQLTTNLAAITDPYVVSLKNVLVYLPPNEQDLLAACISSNTDTTRLVDPTCFKTNFTSLKSQNAQGMGTVFTNSSRSTRSSLGCLSKISQTFGNSTDTATTNLNTALSTIVAQQTTMNNCAAVFVKSMIELLNGRRRFFLTTKANINATVTKDAQGNINGFVFNSTEQSTIVASFKAYAVCLNTFTSAFSTNVIGAEALVGQMGQCRPPASSSAPSGSVNVPATGAAYTSTAQPTSGSQPSGGQPSQGSNGLQGPTFDANGNPVFGPPPGLQQAANATYTNIMNKGSPDWTTVANKLQANFINTSLTSNKAKNMPSLHMTVINFIQNSNWIKQEFDKGVRQEKCTSDYLFYCTSGFCTCSSSGCPSAVSGNTAITTKTSNVQVLPDPTASTASASRLRLLQDAPASGAPGPTSGPNSGPTSGPNSGPNSGPTLGKAPTGQTSGQAPSGSGNFKLPSGSSISGLMPSGMSGMIPNGTSGMMPSGSGMSGMNPSGSNAMLSGSMSGTSGSGAGSGRPPQIPTLNIKNPINDISSYYIAEGCISGRRFIYSEMTSQIQGNIYDFMNQNPQQGGGLAQQMAQGFNQCGNAFLGGNSAVSQTCRGSMNDQCSKALDNTCKNTGLYTQLVNAPQSASPYPDVCNDSQTGSTDAACFSWIMSNLSRSSIAFDYGNFGKLPQLIYNAISANTASSTAASSTAASRLRYLQTVATDATESDSKAQVDGSIKDSDLTIDSATAATVPNPNSYVSNLNSVTAQVSLGASFMNLSFGLFVIVILGLFF